MMSNFKLIAVGVLVSLLVLIDAGDTCRNSYTCMKAHDCLDRHGPNNTLNKQVIFRCGDRVKKVCCPPVRSTPPKKPPASTPSDADPLKHRNYHLLPKECGYSTSPPRIKGGEPATIGQYPWMALLGYKDKNSTSISFLCGGSLINKNYILTAAHCISDTSVNGVPSMVRLGELDLDTEKDCDNEDSCADPVVDLEVDEIITHPNFSKSYVDDIALIRLKKPVEKLPSPTGSIQTICLPIGLDIVYKQNKSSMGMVTLEDKKYRVSGWGKTSFNSKGSRTLQAAFVTSISNEECRQGFDYKVVETQFCTEGKLDATEACKGDSGGPLMDIAKLKSDNEARTYQVGIVSLALGSDVDECSASNPSVYTRVTPYINWILDSMK